MLALRAQPRLQATKVNYQSVDNDGEWELLQRIGRSRGVYSRRLLPPP